ERDVDDPGLQRVRLLPELDELAAREGLERDVAARPLLNLLHPGDRARGPGDVETAQTRGDTQHRRRLWGLRGRAAAHQQACGGTGHGRPEGRRLPSHRDLLIESTCVAADVRSVGDRTTRYGRRMNM